MDPYRIYTRKTMGLDNRVWRLMLVLILLSLGLFSYRLLDKKKCVPFVFAVKTFGIHAPDVFHSGETLTFTASNPSKDIIWNFGDNTEDQGAVAYHEFSKEGIYLVTARSSSLCEVQREITIKKLPVEVKASADAEGQIVGPSSCTTFSEQKFTFTGNANSYEWSTPNNQSLENKNGQTVAYTFRYPGKYTLQVELDHDRTKRYYFYITVEEEVKPKPKLPEDVGPLLPTLPLPPKEIDNVAAPLPAPKPADSVSRPAEPRFILDKTFFDYLQKVMDGEMQPSDFDIYLCGKGSTKVKIEGDNTLRDFNWLCQNLKKTKKSWVILKKTRKVQSVVLHREGKCVTLIGVKYD